MSASLSAVYPRVCGGSELHLCADENGDGLSPRVRGKRRSVVLGQKLRGSIPACAGEAVPVLGNDADATVYPRVCGGSQQLFGQFRPFRGLSPRVRGKPLLILNTE